MQGGAFPTSPVLSPSLESPSPGFTEDVSPSPTDSVTPVPETSASIGTEGATGASVVFITLDVVGDRVEASGMLPEVVEEGGRCTLTLVQGAQRVSVEGDTAAGPQSTYCSLLTVPTSELAPGEWTAVLSYRSDTRSGTSAASVVSLP